ncbi:uncharacterized protein TNCT_707591 [Trichonephila clavata]|uniref:Uncharacterized protein n=1 Tax=Trichonephila clavata TaxID=2740835 RepID=A0A8X6JGF3_TRICU|nr:uncharacterized protein TNCT_707591 [Trichonephila clavata]
MSTPSIADPCPSVRPPAPAHRSEGGGTAHGRHAKATGRRGCRSHSAACSTRTPRHVTGRGGAGRREEGESAQLLAALPPSPERPRKRAHLGSRENRLSVFVKDPFLSPVLCLSKWICVGVRLGEGGRCSLVGGEDVLRFMLRL